MPGRGARRKGEEKHGCKQSGARLQEQRLLPAARTRHVHWVQRQHRLHIIHLQIQPGACTGAGLHLAVAGLAGGSGVRGKPAAAAGNPRQPFWRALWNPAAHLVQGGRPQRPKHVAKCDIRAARSRSERIHFPPPSICGSSGEHLKPSRPIGAWSRHIVISGHSLSHGELVGKASLMQAIRINKWWRRSGRNAFDSMAISGSRRSVSTARYSAWWTAAQLAGSR